MSLYLRKWERIIAGKKKTDSNTYIPLPNLMRVFSAAPQKISADDRLKRTRNKFSVFGLLALFRCGPFDLANRKTGGGGGGHAFQFQSPLETLSFALHLKRAEVDPSTDQRQTAGSSH